jgi:GT2 family glycosyltransferase
MGAVVVANRKIFEAINFWNERFFVYYEDSDLGLRSWAKGYPVIVDGSSRWVHGWARETHGRFRWRPWINEMRALGVFLSLHPEMLFGEFVSRRSHATVATNIGRKIDSSELPTTTGDG